MLAFTEDGEGDYTHTYDTSCGSTPGKAPEYASSVTSTDPSLQRSYTIIKAYRTLNTSTYINDGVYTRDDTIGKILIEDEPTLRESVAKKLRRSGYEMDDCGDGETALELLAAERYDLVLLDLNLPKVNGMTVLRTLRKTDLETPVLILSARSEISDKVEGLDAGANDYLAKPFHLAELEARVRSLTRRQFIQRDVCLRCGRLTFDTKSRLAMADGQPIPLTRKESGVLEYLLLHQGRPVSQEELIEHVWDSSVDAFSNSIRVHISALRKKLRTALGYDPIRNRIGEGYELEENEP